MPSPFSLVPVLVVSALSAVGLFVIGMPPISTIASHYFVKWHPVARQTKVAQTVAGFQTMFQLSAAIDLGLFDTLKLKGPLSAEQLADELRVPLHSIRALVDALCESDYLVVDGFGRYLNSATSLHHLTSGLDPSKDMRPWVSLMVKLAPALATMTDALRQGSSVLEEPGETEQHPLWTHFAKVTGPMAISNARSVVHDFPHGFAGSVLDVAAGSGQYAFEVVRQLPKSRVTLFDFENVLDVARAVGEADATVDMKRVTFFPGNAFTDTPPDVPYDAVIITNMLHLFSADANLGLLKRVHSWLKPGVRLHLGNSFVGIVSEQSPRTGPRVHRWNLPTHNAVQSLGRAVHDARVLARDSRHDP